MKRVATSPITGRVYFGRINVKTELLRLDALRLELQTQLADYKDACTKAETRAVPASTGMHWTENEPVRLPASRAGRVYLAGPMTGLPELNFPAFTQEAERLRDEGLQVLNPADHGIVDGADWADYLRHDITGLASCERIHLLRGWTKSKGACLEMTIAKALGMTVTYQFDAEMEHNNAHAQDQCNACCGTGRMVRDPDIGTDQECFVCDGTGFLPAQEPVTLTPAEIDHAVLEATGFDGFGTQPMNTHDTRNIGLEVIAALRAKEKK